MEGCRVKGDAVFVKVTRDLLVGSARPDLNENPVREAPGADGQPA